MNVRLAVAGDNPQNAMADRALETELRSRGGWLARIIGYSPATGHAEDSWAAQIPLQEACDLGRRFRQDAIYHVREDVLLSDALR